MHWLFPSFLLSLFGGIVADRHSRYKILLVTQTASMIQAALLAALILTHHYVIWEILSLGAVLGIVNAFDVPARQPMVHEMIADKEDLTNAFALNSAMVNIARLVSPALSGLVLHTFGAGVCFSLNALSFMAVIASLLLMKLPPFQPHAHKKEGADGAYGRLSIFETNPLLSVPILMITFLSLFVLPYDTVIPVFAKVIFKGDARIFGFINSFVGLGAICGSLYLASLKKGANLKVILLGASALLERWTDVVLPYPLFPGRYAICGVHRLRIADAGDDLYHDRASGVFRPYAWPRYGLYGHVFFRHDPFGRFADRMVGPANRRPPDHASGGGHHPYYCRHFFKIPYKQTNMEQNSALLVMDMQAAILGGFPDAPGLIDRVNRAIAAARGKKMPVIYVTVGFRQGFPEISMHNKGFSAAKERFAAINMEEFVKIDPRVAPTAEDVHVIKRRVSAFTGSDLEVVLRARGSQHIVLTGVATSGVVLSTLREAADKDYRITVLADGCGDPMKKCMEY